MLKYFRFAVLFNLHSKTPVSIHFTDKENEAQRGLKEINENYMTCPGSIIHSGCNRTKNFPLTD